MVTGNGDKGPGGGRLKREEGEREGGQGRGTWWDVSCAASTPFSRSPSTWS